MKDKFFIDTNVFVYSFDTSNQTKQQKANELIKKALHDHVGIISSQVVQEFINVSTRKFSTPMSIQDSEKYLKQVLSPLCQVFTSIDLYFKALDVMDRWQFSFYDSLIISAALQADCQTLYSEDLQHNQKIQTLTIVNPFF